MTPQSTAIQHLTDIQMGELLDAAATGGAGFIGLEAAEAHLHVCAACAAEFAELQHAITLYQQTSISLADNEFSRSRTLHRHAYPVLPTHRPYAQTLWLVAASAVLMAAILPLEMRWQRTVSTPAIATSVPASIRTAESDEALLQDIDRELSASVPAPMQALSDPTDLQTATQGNTQTLPQGKE